jgi:hypothetical protein
MVENMCTVFDEHVDYVCIQEHAFWNAFERKTHAIVTELSGALVQHILPFTRVPLL